MSFEELINETTIDFPIPINRDSSENLLKYIAENLPGDVRGRIKRFPDFIYDPDKKSVLKFEGTSKMGATISSIKKSMASDTFTFKEWEKDSSYFSGIEFDKVGRELQDYRPEVRELWADVRNVVDKFFIAVAV